jgi:hypothetical protein
MKIRPDSPTGADSGYEVYMLRAIARIHRDPHADGVADLDCGHTSRVYGAPGTLIECRRCDRAELPERAHPTGVAATWTDRGMPEILRHTRRLAPGTWAQVIVEFGRLRVCFEQLGGLARILDAGEAQAIPPGVDYHLEPAPASAFRIAFYRVPACALGAPPAAPAPGASHTGPRPAPAQARICPERGRSHRAGDDRDPCAGPGMSAGAPMAV